MTTEKKQGFISKLLKRKEKHSDGVLNQQAEPLIDEPDLTIDSADESSNLEEQATKNKKVKGKGKKYKAKQAYSEPLNLYVGYYANVKPKDLKEFLFNYATAHVTPIENAFYSIQPYMNGYLWEIHEGGSGKGCLKSIRTILDEQDKVTIIRDNFSVVVVKDEDKVSVSKITSSNLKYHKTNGDVEFVDSMKTLVSEGFGFFVSSVIALMISSVILGSAFINRATERTRITNEHLYDQIIDLPISEITKLRTYMNSEETGIYVQDLKYNRGKKTWTIKAVPTPDYARIKTNVVNRVKSAKALDDEPNSFKDINEKKPSSSKEEALNNLAKKQGK